MFTTAAISVIVIAGAYSLFHSIQAVRIFREEKCKRRVGASVFFRAVDRSASGKVVSTDDAILVKTLASSMDPPSKTPPRKERHPGETTPTPAAVQQSLFQSFKGILNDDSQDQIPPPAPEELPVPEQDLVFGPATAMLAEMLPESHARKESQRQSLVAAGYHSRAAWWNLNATRFVLAFTALLAAGFWTLVASPQTELWALASVVGAPLLMWALPPLLVSSQAAERRIDIERGLPDVLDMLSMGVSQGLTVPASLNRIAPEISNVHPDLSRELSIVNQQAHVGTLHHSLRNFAQRIDSPEVSSFTSLLMQSETTGTSIGRALMDYSDSMRNSLRERADSQANAASFKLLFPTALCLMPAVFLFLLGPAIVDMSNFISNTSGALLETRQEAMNSMDQQPVTTQVEMP